MLESESVCVYTQGSRKMDLNEIGNIYFFIGHDLDKELFSPLAEHTNSIKCMTGYFTRKLSEN